MGHLIVLTLKYCKLCDLYCNLQISIKVLEKFESGQNISLIRKKILPKTNFIGKSQIEQFKQL